MRLSTRDAVMRCRQVGTSALFDCRFLLLVLKLLLFLLTFFFGAVLRWIECRIRLRDDGLGIGQERRDEVVQFTYQLGLSARE